MKKYFIGLILTTSGTAQENSLGNVTVTATKLTDIQYNSVSSVDVVKKEQIEDFQIKMLKIYQI